MEISAFIERLAPDVMTVLRRFPFTVVLVAIATAILLCAINDWPSGVDEQVWQRWFGGFATSGLLALAGYYFSESRPGEVLVGRLLTYVSPLAFIGLFQVTSVEWVVLPLLPLVAILWLSVSPFTRIESGTGKQLQQDKFWWLNHRAIVSAIIAFAAMLIVFLGLLAIERALSILFGIETDEFMYKIVLPFFAGFLAPLYWLSTLPRLDEFNEQELVSPDFLSRAVGFLGQFIFTPLLAIYLLILYAYAAQIAFVRELPQGMLGWMVLVFVVVGAINTLVLYPAFMRERFLVRVFWRYWFWGTLLPLALFSLAVGERVNTYGLTSERVLLIAGGLWAVSLTVCFVIPKLADIRLFPAIAGILLTVCAVGPWNMENVSIGNQAARLTAALESAGFVDADATPKWDKANAEVAASAVQYLAYAEDNGKRLARVLSDVGIEYDAVKQDPTQILALLNVPDADIASRTDTTYPSRDAATQPVNIAQTPVYHGSVYIYAGEWREDWYGMRVKLGENHLSFYDGEQPSTAQDAPDEVPLTTVDMNPWVVAQATHETLLQPFIDFEIGGTHYRLVIDSAQLSGRTGKTGTITSINGQLFSDRLSAN